MPAKIAVVTVSGKAYYLLVNELKKRNIAFLSLTPHDRIPVDVKLVLTTPNEAPEITHDNVLLYREDGDPADIVDEALRIVRGKRTYDSLVIGIDPGRTFGVAVLGDGSILETKECTSLTATVNDVCDVLARTPTTQAIVRIGSGAPSYADALRQQLNSMLPAQVAIESVSEEGTSQLLGQTSHRRGKRDISSAIRIGQRQGRVVPRRKRQE
jgi:hypothetical protein